MRRFPVFVGLRGCDLTTFARCFESGVRVRIACAKPPGQSISTAWQWGCAPSARRGWGCPSASLPRPNAVTPTALKDHPKGPPTANRQPPPTANRHQTPTSTNRHPPPTMVEQDRAL